MNFKEFFQFHEAFIDLMGRDISGVRLRKTGTDDYSYPFNVEVQTPKGPVKQYFEVEINRVDSVGLFGEQVRVPNVYNIDFTGPQRFNLTGMAGAASSKIYIKMLEALLKFSEMKEQEDQYINGFTFSPREIDMRIPYDLFVSRFLLPKGYMLVATGSRGDRIYLRKAWLQQNKKRSPLAPNGDWLDANEKKHLSDVEKQYQDELQQAKDIRTNRKKRAAELKKTENTFRYMKDNPSELAFVAESQGFYFIIVYNLRTKSFRVNSKFSRDEIDWEKPVNEDHILTMLLRMNNPKTRESAAAMAAGAINIPKEIWNKYGVDVPDAFSLRYLATSPDSDLD
jgi:hypothetical protein